MNSKLIGSIMMVAGTSIGAGMLLLPISSSEVGYYYSGALLITFYFLLIIPALAYIELVQFGPKGSTVSTFMKMEFGNVGYTVSHALLISFVYAVMSAYFGGVSGVLSGLFEVPEQYQLTLKIIVCLLLGLIVVFSNRLADLINRVFFYIMLIAFVILLGLALGKIRVENLMSLPTNHLVVIKTFPILFFTYGFHIIIPSLAEYLDNDVKALKKAVVIGLAIPCIFFLTWTIVTHGVVSQEQLIAFAHSSKVDIGEFIKDNIDDSHWLGTVISIFSISALVTSFIGVSLGLIIMLRETFIDKEATDATGKIVSRLNTPALFVLAIVIPLVIVVLFPNAFNIFLYVASVLFTLQSIIFPIILIVRFRKMRPELYANENVYRCKLSSGMFMLFALFSLICAMATLL